MADIWKQVCKQSLYELRLHEAALSSLPDEIALTKDRMTSIKSASSGSAPVQGGGTSYEDRLNNAIVKIDLMENNMDETRREVELTKRALNNLSEEEQHILDVLYIQRQKRGVDRLCEELCVDESTVWRRASRALSRYSAARYGKT